MKFSFSNLQDARGKILARSQRADGGKIAKGTLLSDDDIARLQKAGAETIAVAEMEDGDVRENDAADKIAGTLCGNGAYAESAKHGRANIYAEHAGVLTYDADDLNFANRVCADIAAAALPPFARVAKGRMLATVKIIPFAAQQQHVKQAMMRKNVLQVRPFNTACKVALVQTELPNVKSVCDKTANVTRLRLAERGCVLDDEWRCQHDRQEILAAVSQALKTQPDILLIAGASAVCDVQDDIPAAICQSGGSIERFGMPVDPGNLLVLGHIGNVQCVVLPGCARSPKDNGFDRVLDRLLANIPISGNDIADMGAGGLLDDIATRPFKRASSQTIKPKIGAVLLAAGMSRRMGSANKLLQTWRGKPLVAHAAQTLAKAVQDKTIHRAIAVCGADSEKVAAILADSNISAAVNPDYAQGMASSLACGLRALNAEDLDAVLVMLGDMPLVSENDIRAVADCFDPSADGIVVPVCRGRRGNPVLLAARHFATLAQLQGDTGARALFAKHSVTEAPASPGVLFDMDSPEEFAASADESACSKAP